ncbi:hypothetical protein CAEBREN_17306, partial [Caenorhabditis brenneri]
MSTPEPQQLGSGGSGGDAQEVDMDTREDQAQEGSSARAGQETVPDEKKLEAQEEDAVEEGRGTEDKELRTQAPQPGQSSTELRRSSRAVARPDYIGMDNGESQGQEEESQGYVLPRSQSRRAAMTDGNGIAAPSEAVLERPRRGERVNYENYFESQELIEDGNEEERVGAKKRVGEEPAQNEETPKRKRGRPKNKPLPDPGQDPEGAAAPTSAEPSTPAVVEPVQATEVELEDLMQGPPPVSTEPSTSSAGQPGVGKEGARKRKDNGEEDVKPTKVPKTRSKPRQKKEGEEVDDEPMELDAEDSMEGPPPISTEPSTSSAGQPGVSVKERARKRKKEKDPDWKMRKAPKSRSKPRQKKEGEEGNDEEPMDVDDEEKDSEEKRGEESPRKGRRMSGVSKPRNKKKDGDDVKENGPSSSGATPELDRTFYIFMPNAFAHTKKLEELKSSFFNIQRYQLRRLMEDTERDEEWLKQVLAYTNCIRAQFAYTHTWAACYALMLSPWGLDEETKKRILEKENDKKKCKKFLITPPLVSIPGIPNDLQKELWMLPATHHLHNIKEAQKDEPWLVKATRMVLVIFSEFLKAIKEFNEFGEAFLSNMLNFDKEVSRKILDSVKFLLLKDIVEEEPRIQDAEDPLHQMVAKLLVDKNTPSTSTAVPPSRPEPPHSAGSLGLSTGPSTSTDPSGSSSPRHPDQSQPHQPLSDDKDAPQQENGTQTEQNTEWLKLIKKFRENMKDFEWAQEYLAYPSPFPHEVVLNVEEWETLGQLKDRGKKDVKEKKRVVEKKIVAKKVVSEEGKGEVVILCGKAVRLIVDDDEQGELGLQVVDMAQEEQADATVPVRCVERMIESVVIRPGVPVKDDEDDLQEDNPQGQQPAQHVSRIRGTNRLRRERATRRQKAAQQAQAATQEPQDLDQQVSDGSEGLQQQQESIRQVSNGQDAAPQHQEFDELDLRTQQVPERQQELANQSGDDPEKPAKVQAIVEDIRREVQPFLPVEVRNVESAADHQIEEERPIGNGADHQMEDQVVRPVEDEVNPQEEARPDQDMEVDHHGQAAAWDVEDFQMEDVRQVEEDVTGPPVDDVPGYKQIFNLDTNTVVTVKDVTPGTSRNVATSPMRFDDSHETQQPSTSDLQKAPDEEVVEDSVKSGVEFDELEFMDDNSGSSVLRNDFEKELRVEEAPETLTTSVVDNQSSLSWSVNLDGADPESLALFRAFVAKNPERVNPLAQNVGATDVGAASSGQNNASKDDSIPEDHVVAVTEPHEAPGEGNELEPMDTNESAANSTEHSAVDEAMVVQNEANPQIEEPVVQENDQSLHAPHKETSTRKDRDNQMDVDNSPEIEGNETTETSSPPKVAVDQLTAEDDQRMDEEKNEHVTMGTGLNQEEANVGAASSSQNNASKDASIQEDHVVAVTEQHDALGDGIELGLMNTQESAANSTEHSAVDEAMAVQNEANPQMEEPVVQENDQYFHAPHGTGIIAESVSTSPETSTRKDRDDQMDVDNAPEIEDDETAETSTLPKVAVRNASEVAMETEDQDPRNETTENSNGVVQETSSELLVPPIEAEKDPDQTPMEVDSLPVGSLSRNESGSVPRNAPGKACKSSTRTPTTPVTENLAPMLRSEYSAADEAIVVRSDKKKTNDQEKKGGEELSAVMNEENETAETSNPPKVAVDQLGSKPVDGEDPDEISPEMGKHVSPMSADVHKDQSSPMTPDDAQSSTTADSVVPTLDSSAEENLQILPESNDEDHQMENEDESQVKALPNPSSYSETLKEDQSQANTLPDSSSCLKIGATGSEN